MAYAVVCGLLFSAFGPPAPAGRQVVPSFIYRGRSLDLETFWLLVGLGEISVSREAGLDLANIQTYSPVQHRGNDAAASWRPTLT